MVEKTTSRVSFPLSQQLRTVTRLEVSESDKVVLQEDYKNRFTRFVQNQKAEELQQLKEMDSLRENPTKVMEFLFKENKHKQKSSHQQEYEDQDKSVYLSALNTRRNPDMILPDGGLMRGDRYYQKKAAEEQAEETKSPTVVRLGNPHESSQEDEEQEKEVQEADEYSKMKAQGTMQRYWQEDNITLKCRNCKQHGHLATNCGNKTKMPNCILCGKDSHDSFDCNAKQCFRCSKSGHEARCCTETNIIRCNNCNMAGHLQNRCLIAQEDKNDVQKDAMHYAVCLQCGKKGHLKCQSERRSHGIEVDCSWQEDLSIFEINKHGDIKNLNKLNHIQKKHSPAKHINNTNVWLADKDDQYDYWQTIPAHHSARKQYCCKCTGGHSEDRCFNREQNGLNTKYKQMERVRKDLASQQGGNYGRGGYQQTQQASQYSRTLGSDPRRKAVGKQDYSYHDRSRPNQSGYDVRKDLKVGDKRKHHNQLQSGQYSSFSDESYSEEELERSKPASQKRQVKQFQKMIHKHKRWSTPKRH